MAPQEGGKKAQFYEAIVQQKLRAVRYGVAKAGVAPATRNEEDMTTFMIACAHAKDRSLAELIRWYERRVNQLRECLEQARDDDGRTCMHMACAHPGGTKCVQELLDAWLRVDGKRRDAGLVRRDAEGKTPLDLARGKTRELIEEWLAEPETDEDAEEDAGVDDDGLTSTQRNKLKKKALEASERRGGTSKEARPPEKKDDEDRERGELPTEMPEPTWPEVASWVESVKNLRPICELSVDKTDAEEVPLFDGSPVDPALWYCDSLNRLQLRLGPGLVALHDQGLAKLSNLSTLIVAGHSLASLPACIGSLPLKSLDASRNKLSTLPATMPKSLEALDISANDIEDLIPLAPCDQLVTLAVDSNPRLEVLALPFAKLKRLVHLSASSCVLGTVDAAVGDLAKLETLVLSGNPITELPATLAACKKLKDLKVDQTNISDNKVLGYIHKGEMKQLAKYWEKHGASGGSSSKSKGGSGKKGKR